jgi:molybdopterin/thiamine biosynthesis adenylyltransferase
VTATNVASTRFDRQLVMAGFDQADQDQLANAHVLLAGVGGVGGATATYLAAAGVGRITIVHPGPLELPDLNRQTLMRPDWVGRSRAECAAASLALHYPDVEVVAHDLPVDGAIVGPMVDQADVVVDTRHNFPERYTLNACCVERNRPLVAAAMSGADGVVLTVRPGRTACWACVFPEGDPEWEPLGFPVLGAVAGVHGVLAALEAIKVVTGWGMPLEGHLLALDLFEGTTRQLEVSRLPDCPICGAP